LGCINEGLNLYKVLQTASDKLRLSEICKTTDKQKTEYCKHLDEFININSSNSTDKAKGDILESLSKYLLNISGGIFDIDKNLRTSTNEIDLLVKLNSKGLLLSSINIIDKRFSCFISECKNYKTAIGVTHIGKFCSLLLSTQVKLGIVFSYHGVTGNGWNYAAGLIKKFYLSKENIGERFCIIDFNVSDFIRIKHGDNFFQIINEKLMSLQFDTDYSKYLSKHPAES